MLIFQIFLFSFLLFKFGNFFPDMCDFIFIIQRISRMCFFRIDALSLIQIFNHFLRHIFTNFLKKPSSFTVPRKSSNSRFVVNKFIIYRNILFHHLSPSVSFSLDDFYNIWENMLFRTRLYFTTGVIFESHISLRDLLSSWGLFCTWFKLLWPISNVSWQSDI